MSSTACAFVFSFSFITSGLPILGLPKNENYSHFCILTISLFGSIVKECMRLVACIGTTTCWICFVLSLRAMPLYNVGDDVSIQDSWYWAKGVLGYKE